MKESRTFHPTPGKGLNSSALDSGTEGTATLTLGSLGTMANGDETIVPVGEIAVLARTVVHNNGSLGSEPVHGTLGSAGGGSHTNVGVHGGEPLDVATGVEHTD